MTDEKEKVWNEFFEQGTNPESSVLAANREPKSRAYCGDCNRFMKLKNLYYHAKKDSLVCNDRWDCMGAEKKRSRNEVRKKKREKACTKD